MKKLIIKRVLNALSLRLMGFGLCVYCYACLRKMIYIEKVMVFSRTNTHAGQDWSARLGARPRSRDIPREKKNRQKHGFLARGLTRVRGRGTSILLHFFLVYGKPFSQLAK